VQAREHKQGEQQIEREKQTPHWAGNPTQGLIPGSRDPGSQDPDLSWKQTLNPLSHTGAPPRVYSFFKKSNIFKRWRSFGWFYKCYFMVQSELHLLMQLCFLRIQQMYTKTVLLSYKIFLTGWIVYIFSYSFFQQTLLYLSSL